jgi:glycosyltransferase involved in cell wall biosynthesis
MRILFVEPFGQHEGHPPAESKRVTDALTAAGVHITLVTFDGVRGDWVKTSQIEQHLSFVPKLGPLSGLFRLFILMLKSSMVLRFVADIIETAPTLFLALRESQRRRYDTVHIFDGNPSFIFTFASALFTRNYNFVVNIYSPPPTWELRDGFQSFRESLKNRDYRNFLHLVLVKLINTKGIALLQRFIYRRGLKRNFFSFFCHTKELKEVYRTYLGGIFYDKIHVIPLGRKRPGQEERSRQQARQYLHLPQEAKIFLCFGTNHVNKDYEAIFRAVQDMPRVCYLLFVGYLATDDRVRDPQLLAQKYNWAENTIVINKFVPEEEKPNYFYASDAILLSYVKDLISSASVINDACQFQLPAIASDAGQLGEYVKDYNLGMTFAPGNPGSLRQAITSFLNLSEKERLAIKANFYKFASDLSWEEVANRYIALYSGEE